MMLVSASSTLGQLLLAHLTAPEPSVSSAMQYAAAAYCSYNWSFSNKSSLIPVAVFELHQHKALAMIGGNIPLTCCLFLRLAALTTSASHSIVAIDNERIMESECDRSKAKVVSFNLRFDEQKMIVWKTTMKLRVLEDGIKRDITLY
jgi:hypothetical protein